VRTYVYEQLGISKPGFWADWRKRTIEEPEPDEYTADEDNEINDPTQEYHLAKWPEQEKAKKKDFTPMAMDMGTPQAGPDKSKRTGLAWAPLLENQSKQWFKQNPLVGSSSLDLMGLERAMANKGAAEFLYGLGKGGTGYEGLKNLAQYYVKKTQERAVARGNRPFGAGEPTNFDKMMAMLEKPKPPYTPPTFEILTQGTSTLTSKVPNYTIGQLNVSQNGYVTNSVTPQNKASNMIASKKANSIQTVKPAGLQAAGKIKL